MTVTTAPPQPPKAAAPVRETPRLTSGHLPVWAPWAILVGSLVASAMLFAIIAMGSGEGFNLAGWAVVAGLLYLALITIISSLVEGRRKGVDRLVTGVVTIAFLIAMVPLVSVAITVVVNGVAGLSAEFFTSSMRNVVGEGGGALHAIVGTVLITLAAAVISIPIGIFTAIYLVEYGRGGRLSRGITFLVDVMTGIPSIVAGLFAFALFALFVGPAVRFGFAGAVALTVLMIPIVVRSTEEMLKIVPNELREAAYALGVPKWRTILKVVIPTTAGGIATGVMLAVARVIGETAPLLVTTGLALGVNLNPFSGPMATLPVFSYYSYAVPGIPREAFLDRAWTAALVLMLVVMVLNIVARIISRIFAPKTR